MLNAFTKLFDIFQEFLKMNENTKKIRKIFFIFKNNFTGTENHYPKPSGDADSLETELINNSLVKKENFQTQEECLNSQAELLPPNDQFKDSNSNTSNDRQQKSDDTQLQQEQPDRHAEVIVKTDKLANTSNNINTSKDESQKKDGSNQYFNSKRSTSV